MQLSERGYRKIRAYEGYCKALPDGRCTSYRETINGKLDTWTIGYGCTRGVEAGMIWTQEQADAALKAEIARHEARVTKLSTVDLNQNEFDALVSFDFNCGGLTDDSGKPTGVLRAVNGGNRLAVVAELKRWNKFNKVPAKALIARRADEAALFLEPVEPAQPDTMPQAAEPTAKPVTPLQAAVVASSAAGVGSQIIATPIPPVPSSVTDSLTNISLWQSVVDQASGVLTTVASAPIVSCVIAAACGVMWFWPNLSKKLGWTS